MIALGLAACSEQEQARAPGPARVVVSIPPLAGLVRDALPINAEIEVLIPAGMSPHGFEAKASDLAKLRRADLVIVNGLGVEFGLEKMLESTDHPGRDEIVFAEVVGIDHASHASHAHGGHEDHIHDKHGAHDEHGDAEDHIHDEHGAHDEHGDAEGHIHDEHGEHDDGHGHDHGGMDPHLWLDPSLARQLIDEVALWDLRGSGGGDVRAALERTGAEVELLDRIDAVDSAYRERLGPYHTARIVTDHRAWDRLFGRYGLEVAAVIRPIERIEPSPGVLASVIETVREAEVRAVFVEPQFAGGPAERIAQATGVPIGRLDPLGSGDWFAMMEANLDEIVRVLEASDGAGKAGGP